MRTRPEGGRAQGDGPCVDMADIGPRLVSVAANVLPLAAARARFAITV
jgi:hypothetical protein